MADRALAYLRSGLNWYAARTDDWVSPIVRGMARTKPKERAGTRVLADDEIRDVWSLSEGFWLRSGAFLLGHSVHRQSAVANAAGCW